MTRCAFIASLFLIVMPAGLIFAGDIEVPDLETRIKNEGSQIPQSAIPELTPPVPAALPPEDAKPLPVATAPAAVPSAVPAVPAAALAESVAPIPAKKNLSGHAAFGVGSASLLAADVAIERTADAFPGFSLSFNGDSADGYSPSGAGNGFFDRDMALAAGLSGESDSGDWFARASVDASTDGFQGLNPDYVSFSRRDVYLSSLIASIPLGKSPLTGSVGFDGSVFSAYGDRSSTLSPSVSIDPYTGYDLSPRVAISWAPGAFSAGLSLACGYETAVGSGELLNGSAGLDLRYHVWDLDMTGTVSLSGDSADGLLVPFNVALSYGKDGSFIRGVHLSGGLSCDRSSPWVLAEKESFTLLEGHSLYSSDWNLSGGFVIAPFDALSLTAEVEYRTTAYGRGILVVTDSMSALTADRYTIVRTARQSFVTKAGASWSVGPFVLEAGYTGEWLDRLYRTTLHSLDSSVKVSGSGSLVWDAKLSSSFSLDSAELPVLGLVASVHPASDLSFSVSLDDGLPALFGVTRMRNSLYADRSGILSFRARIDL